MFRSSVTTILFFLLLLSFSFVQTQPLVQYRIFELNGRRVKVTHLADPHFYGRYQGAKGGYLLLSENGTGEYRYDIVFPATGCDSGIIQFEWGFLVDENDSIVRFEREYGFSYPIIYKCTGKNCFQGCRVSYLVDYIMDKKGEILEVSSSDDWVKVK